MSKSLREGNELRHAAPLLLVVEGLDTISAALVREGGDGETLLGALRVPRGGSIEALGVTLAASAGLSGVTEEVRGGVAEAAVAAGRLAERLGVPIRVVEVEGDASRMLLVVRCPLLAAHEMRRGRVFPVASRMCSRPLACRLLSVARYPLDALPAGCCLLRGVCCLPHVALSPVALLSVVNGLSQIPRCPLHAATLPVACWRPRAVAIAARSESKKAVSL